MEIKCGTEIIPALLSILQNYPLTEKQLEILNILASIPADGLSSSIPELLDKIFIQKIKQAGYEYHLWTVDDLKIAQKFSQIGVNSLTTNRPDLLVSQF